MAKDLKFKKRPFWRIDKFRLNNIIEMVDGIFVI